MNMRSLLPMLVLAAVATRGAQAANAPVANRSPLEPNAFNALPLGSVMPKGWLLEQLRLQAQGISGHLDEFWGDLGPQSAWLGGSGEAWGGSAGRSRGWGPRGPRARFGGGPPPPAPGGGVRGRGGGARPFFPGPPG